MDGVLYRVLGLLAQGKTVKGSIELPDSLLMWNLDYDGVCLKFRLGEHYSLDDQISLTCLGQHLIEGPIPADRL